MPKYEILHSDHCLQTVANLSDAQLLGVGMSAHQIIGLPAHGTKARGDAILEIAQDGNEDGLKGYFGVWLLQP